MAIAGQTSVVEASQSEKITPFSRDLIVWFQEYPDQRIKAFALVN